MTKCRAHESVLEERREGDITVDVSASSVYVAVPKMGDRGPTEEGAVAEYSDIIRCLQSIGIDSRAGYRIGNRSRAEVA